MKNVLALRLGQSLSMTPALQQAIRLLQTASVDLQQEIQDALDGNLMLEAEEAEGSAESEFEAEAERNEGGEELELRELDARQQDIPDEPGDDFSWNDIYVGSSDNPEAQQALHDYRQASLTAATSLHDHLLEQAQLLGLNAEEQLACAHLIDAVDEQGYLRDYPLLRADIETATGLRPAIIDKVLRALQTCDPAGVAARDISECLLLQLRGSEDAATELARLLVRQHLAALASTPLDKLARQLGQPLSLVEEALGRIRGLAPHPGAPFIDHESDYVAPDLFVRKREGRWEVHLNPEIAPRIRINTAYQAYMRRGDSSPEQQTLKQHLTEARHFLHALRSRNDTLLRVGQEIVDLQRGFLEYGAEAMKPLVLRDIADRLGMHESTVSRATASKYMHTPRGLFELKYFFSSAVSTTEGGSCSATAIQAMIKRFVAGENAAKPLSDAKLVQLLQDEGVDVARRTVAKYRETLGIPPTHERRVRA